MPVEVFADGFLDDLPFLAPTLESEPLEALVGQRQEVDGLSDLLEAGALAANESRIRRRSGRLAGGHARKIPPPSMPGR